MIPEKRVSVLPPDAPLFRLPSHAERCQVVPNTTADEAYVLVPLRSSVASALHPGQTSQLETGEAIAQFAAYAGGCGSNPTRRAAIEGGLSEKMFNCGRVSRPNS